MNNFYDHNHALLEATDIHCVTLQMKDQNILTPFTAILFRLTLENFQHHKARAATASCGSNAETNYTLPKRNNLLNNLIPLYKNLTGSFRRALGTE